MPLLLPALLLGASEPQQIDLWERGDGGVHTYRIPALVETKRGTLIAVADARHDGPADMPARISLVMRRSFDGGRTWKASRVIRAVKEGGVGDASLLLDRKTGACCAFTPTDLPASASSLPSPGP